MHFAHHCCSEITIINPEPQRSSRAACVLETCDFSRSCGNALGVVLLYSKVSIFQPELREHSFRTILLYLRIAILEPDGAGQGGIEPAAIARAGAQTTRQISRTIREQRKRENSQGTTARALRRARSPQGSPTISHGATARALRHREFAEDKTHSRGATARALRPARSPQRVRRDQIRTAPQRGRFDTHDLRKEFAEVKTNSHGVTARALRHARSAEGYVS